MLSGKELPLKYNITSIEQYESFLQIDEEMEVENSDNEKDTFLDENICVQDDPDDLEVTNIISNASDKG